MRALRDVSEELPEYPFTSEDRLDSHYFMAWERRRWLNSDMRLKGTPECRALYFDLICISFDQSPMGTLPDDLEVLARLLLFDPTHFKALVALDFGPLHKWRRYRCGDEVRLGHDVIVRTLLDATARRQDNRARTEAANTQKRLQRLRQAVGGLHKELAANDAAIMWMDRWLTERGIGYRNMDRIEGAMRAWLDFSLTANIGGSRA